MGRVVDEIIRSDFDDIFFRSKSLYRRLEKTRVLITGAYGMITLYLTMFLIYLCEEQESNLELILVVRSKKKLENRIGRTVDMPYVTVVESDLSEALYITGKVDYIIHAASPASSKYYAESPIEVIMPNVMGTNYILELAKQKNCRSILFFSSCDIYGLPLTSYGEVTEDTYGAVDTLDLYNCYTESKRMAETMCRAYYKEYDVNVKIVRIWPTYAPTMDIYGDDRAIASFTKNIIQNSNIEMYSDGKSKKCFCYITDAIDGFFRIMLDGASGEAYNLCNESQYYSIKELAEILIKISNNPNIKVIEKKKNCIQNPFITKMDIFPSSKKLRMLGWQCYISVEEGFKKVLAYQRKLVLGNRL